MYIIDILYIYISSFRFFQIDIYRFRNKERGEGVDARIDGLFPLPPYANYILMGFSHSWGGRV